MNVKKVILSVITATCLFSINANALTLKETLNEVLETNPVVQERLKNLNETREDLNIAKSEWLPSLDYRGTIGRNNSGDLKDSGNSSFNHTVRDSSYSHYTNSLKLTQNIEYLKYVLVLKWFIIIFNSLLSIYLILTLFKNSEIQEKSSVKKDKVETKNSFTQRETELLHKKKLINKAENIIKNR